MPDIEFPGVSPHEQFLVERTQQFGVNHCFLCGKHIPVGAADRTIEHVFPKWLLRALDLWDSSVNQINGRRLRYRQLTVPCCSICNGVDLSAIESRVRVAFAGGLEAFAALDSRDLFLWLGKIYYGLVYKESLQPLHIRESAGPRLIPAEHLASVAFHHFLLQSAADVVNWQPILPGPATFHFFECLDSDEPRMRFDYMDDLLIPMLGIRMGRIGVIAVLQDWGRSEGVVQPQIEAARTFALHPTQFREAYARLAYMTASSWRDVSHVVASRDGVATVMTRNAGGFDGTWVWADFAPRLAGAWAVPVEAIFDGETGMSTIGGGDSAPIPVESMEVAFVAAFSGQGLWPYAGADLIGALDAGFAFDSRRPPAPGES